MSIETQRGVGSVKGTAMDMIDILVVDDHPIVREGLVAILEGQDDFNVVAE